MTWAYTAAFEAGSGPDASKQEKGETQGDRVLTTKDFSQVVAEHNETGLLVEFFLPWCGHSQRLRPEFRRAAIGAAGKPYFARVDCSSATGLPVCQAEEIQYHPTILLFMRGLSFEYQQRVTSSALVKYCEKMRQPAVRVLSGLEDTVSTLQQEQVLVVAFHTEGERYEDFFAQVAENLRDQIVFASISKQEYIDKLGIAKVPAYCVMRLGYPTLLWSDPVKDGESEALAFSRFVTAAHVRLIDTLTQENFHSKLGLGVPALILFTDESAASHAALRSLYQPAMDLKGRINFCTVSGVRYQSLAVKLGVSARLLPSMVIVDVGNETQHVLPSTVPITDKTVAKFCNDYLEGRLAPTLRSGVVPAYEEGPVFTLVADDFRRLVHDSNVDVMVTFRTTWCGFCNLFSPVFHSLATATSSIQSLKFFEFDVGDNDPEAALNISSYPTVMFFPAENKTGLVYDGPRTVAQLTAFLREHVMFPAISLSCFPPFRSDVSRHFASGSRVSIKLATGPDGQLLSQEEADRLEREVSSLRESLRTAQNAEVS